jgi:transcriptional regulator EpsA
LHNPRLDPPLDPDEAFELSAAPLQAGADGAAEALTLSHEDRMSLMQIIDASFQVVKRHHFFSWSQGVVQFLVPHEILVCGMSGSSDPGMHMYFFSSSRYFNQDRFEAVCHAETGLMRHMISHWDSHGQPCLIGKSGRTATCNPAWLAQLEHNELRNAAAHGMRGADGTIKSFFCFARVKEPFPTRLAYILHVLTPFFDATLSRVLAQEERDGHANLRAKIAVTGREMQILAHLKDGRTNPEIAALLGLSPHTVKNHVRNIMHKLGAQSRAQAAVKAMQLGVLKFHRE